MVGGHMSFAGEMCYRGEVAEGVGHGDSLVNPKKPLTNLVLSVAP